MRLEKSDGHTFVVGSWLHERVNILWDICSVTTGQDGVASVRVTEQCLFRPSTFALESFPVRVSLLAVHLL